MLIISNSCITLCGTLGARGLNAKSKAWSLHAFRDERACKKLQGMHKIGCKLESQSVPQFGWLRSWHWISKSRFNAHSLIAATFFLTYTCMHLFRGHVLLTLLLILLHRTKAVMQDKMQQLCLAKLLRTLKRPRRHWDDDGHLCLVVGLQRVH